MHNIRDGDIYKNITVFGRSFELRYGYYEEYEKEHGEPIPIYPDFKSCPQYTENGEPFVTAMQDVCVYFNGEDESLGCYACKHYRHGDDLIGICLCSKTKNTN